MINFAWLWLATLGVFLLGLRAAWLTGQADPWAWGLPALMILAVTGVAIRRSALWAAVGAAGTALLFCDVAAARWPDPFASSGLIALALLAAGGGWLLRDRHRLAGGCALGLAILLLCFGPARPVSIRPDRPPLAVITALPLFWEEGGAGLAMPVGAPIVTLLRARFAVKPLDDPRALAGSGARWLLLAQPRAMPPEALVAIDTWVRDGGTALILADPLLRWPSALPMGDRRRAPTVSQLGPLLAHWGLEGARAEDGEVRHFTPDNRLITLSGFGLADPLLSAVTIGKGRALLLRDADLIDDRLWLADPARPLDPRAWSADTPALVLGWLGDALPLDRRWMRDAGDVLRAIRWAMIFAAGWALLGALSLRPAEIRTKHEKRMEKADVMD